MSDKFSKTGLSSGSSWSLLTENTAFEEPDTVVEKQEKVSSTTRLHAEDSGKFGLCPAREYLQLAVCKQCQKLVLLSSIQRHYELKHQKFLSSVKPSIPRRCIPSSLHTTLPKSPPVMHSKPPSLISTTGKSFIRIEEVNPNELNVKIEEVPLTIPQFSNTVTKGKLPRINIKKLTNDSTKKHNSNNNNNNNNNIINNNINSTNNEKNNNNHNSSSNSSTCSNNGSNEISSISCTEITSSPASSPQVCIQVKGNYKKIPHLKVKEYDVDKHCGVWIPEMEQNCTRSFTCKTHPLSLRRQVPGRSKDFDVLLAEHRAKVALKGQDTASCSSSSPQTSSSVGNTPVHSPFGFDKIVFPTVRGSSSSSLKDTAGSSIKSSNSSPAPSKSIPEEASQPSTEYSPQVFVDYILDDVIGSSNLPTVIVYPKPISTNTFGARQTDCKCRVFSRRMDHFRNATSSMLDRFNSSSTLASMNPTDPTKVGKDGLRLAVQDPLQNGILYKQKTKTGKISGTKRHLSANDNNQGIMAESVNYVANSKRRHSSEVPVVDPFSITNPPNISRSISYPAHSAGQHLVKVKEFQRTNENNLICHRPKLNDSITNSVATNSSEYLIISTSAKVDKLSSTTGSSSNLSVNSNLNLCHSLGISKTDASINLRQGSFDQTFSSLSKISAAPNITITQGMIVSLPPAVLQNSQQNIYSIGSQIKDLITNSSPTRTVQQISTPSTPPALKQALADANMSSFQNGLNNSLLQDKNYSYTTSDKQELAPNITVTASSALSGVLQGHVVSATLSGIPKSNFKRLNSVHSDQTGLLQQIVVQQSNPSSRDLSAYKTTRSPTTTQGLLSPSVTTMSNNPVSSRQSFLNSPNNANSNNSQPIKHLQKMQLQQLQQQQLQNQQFLVHHGYQQQILPKLPTVPNSMTQFNASQFPTSGSQASLQFLTQGSSSNPLQQQHGGTLS